MAQIIVENGKLPQKQFEISIEFFTVNEGEFVLYSGTIFRPIELEVCPWKGMTAYTFHFRRNYNWTHIGPVEIFPPEDSLPCIDADHLAEQLLTLIEGYEVRNN